ncbi:hypothetical protein FRD01_13015 [Microvenator marinus]|uniref:Uncharacterized protein n=1 Tax=Microvenator marinus TaxID=2600177 RepID=A0A5B8XRG6_9DELT|nr:hypothetical protein [Microvenator marinus]QED28134.1 hypothetical protein FRD01_13015 [Microvenator marinus]
MFQFSRLVIVLGLVSQGCHSPKQVDSKVTVEGSTSAVESPRETPHEAIPDPVVLSKDLPEPEVTPAPSSTPQLALPTDANAREKTFYNALKKSEAGVVEMSLEVVPGPSDACFAVLIDAHQSSGSYDIRESGFQTTDCVRTFEIAHTATHTRWSNPFGDVDISPFMVAGNGRTIWSPAHQCDIWFGYSTSCEEYSKYTVSHWLEFSLHPQSVVGPIVSFSRVWTKQAAGGTGPSHGQDGWTVDIRTGNRAQFDALITTESLLQSLKKDPFLQRELGEKLQEAASPEDVWKMWGTDTFAKFGTYYFNEWSSKRGQAAMRIYFLETTDGLSPNELRSLGVWVTPKEEFRSVFEAAAKKEGGFMGSRP